MAVGLFFTGGVESTLLLHQLSTEHDVLQLYTVLNPYINMERIHHIVSYVNMNNNVAVNVPFTIPLKNPETDKDRTFIRWARHLAKVEVDMLYIGSNEHMDHLPKRQYLIHDKIHMPFKGLQKDKIVEMYKNTGMTELLKMTHSCFMDRITHCGNCIGCIERTWAFERNNV